MRGRQSLCGPCAQIGQHQYQASQTEPDFLDSPHAAIRAALALGKDRLMTQSNDLIDRMNWRYATKKMDPAKSVAADKVQRNLEASRLAPTSHGLPPL